MGIRVHLVDGPDAHVVGLLVLRMHVIEGEGEAARTHEPAQAAAPRLPHTQHCVAEHHHRMDRRVVVNFGDAVGGALPCDGGVRLRLIQMRRDEAR